MRRAARRRRNSRGPEQSAGAPHAARALGTSRRARGVATVLISRQHCAGRDGVCAAFIESACASVLRPLAKHRARTRRNVAFHALEDVTPRLLVCFWTWLATSIYEASSLGICCWSQRLKRGGRKRTHVFLPTAPRLIAALRPRTQRRGSQPTLNTECCTHYYLAARRRAPHT